MVGPESSGGGGGPRALAAVLDEDDHHQLGVGGGSVGGEPGVVLAAGARRTLPRHRSSLTLNTPPPNHMHAQATLMACRSSSAAWAARGSAIPATIVANTSFIADFFIDASYSM